MNDLRISSYQEQPLQASKWLEVQALLESDEMALLFDVLAPFSLFQCGSITQRGIGGEEGQKQAKADFLSHYKDYVESLKSGELPLVSSYQICFSSVLTATNDCLYVIPIGEDRQLIRVSTPVIQMQAHTIGYSPIDKKFRSMVFGSDNIPWGIQFSYPQLFQDPISKQPTSVNDASAYPNTQLFRSLQKWMREHTTPTPFVVDGIMTNVPMRLGRKCYSWVNRHPQLVSKGISVC